MEGDCCHWLTTSKSNTEKTRGKCRRGQAEEFSRRRRENNITYPHLRLSKNKIYKKERGERQWFLWYKSHILGIYMMLNKYGKCKSKSVDTSEMAHHVKTPAGKADCRSRREATPARCPQISACYSMCVSRHK